MTTKFFSNWANANTFQDQLASESGVAFSARMNYADALVVTILSDYGAVVGEECRDICVTDDPELVEIWRERGYDVDYINAGAGRWLDQRWR